MQHIDKAIAALRYVGVDTVRIRAPIVGSDSYRRIYAPLAKAGFRFLFTHAPGKDPKAEVVAMATIGASSVIGHEGPNEPDLNTVTFGGITDARRRGSTWAKADAALALMRAQRDALRADPAFAHTTIVAFNDWFQKQQKPFTSVANAHIYPAGKTLRDMAATVAARVKAHGRGKIWLTEWGYTNGAGTAFREVSEEDQAARLAGDIAWINGRKDIARAFIYTLVDYPGDNEYSRFGLFNEDWSPKPAAEAVRAAIRAT
jgi:hypothetical protein